MTSFQFIREVRLFGVRVRSEQQERQMGEPADVKRDRMQLRLDAKNERARTLYESNGFRASASEPRRLFLPLETFEKLGL